MSDAAPPAALRDAAPDGTGPVRGARPARWLDRLSVLLLIAAAGVVTAAAAPEMLRVAGFAPVVVEKVRAAPPAAPHTPRRTGLPFDDDRAGGADDDSPHLTELERLFPDDLRPNHRTDPRDAPAPGSKPRVGRALSGLTLREHGDTSAAVTGKVPAGVRLMVVREAGEWVMVVWQSPDGILAGWTPRGGISAP